MRILIASVALCVAVLFTGTSADAAASGKFFDQQSKKWVTYGSARQGKSSIQRKQVRYNGSYRPNTLVISTKDRRLYHIRNDGTAMVYGVGVGRTGFQWSGTHRISRKAEWPGWTPPQVMIDRERRKGRTLPRYMKGGPNNPLGARAMYIGSTIYRIHGSNEPWTIGSAVSSGCIRMANEDVIHLYNNVSVGTKVVVLR
ncbi:L,D-transpeptidase [Pseudovibrio sp. Tun.PSC04-5.I4]|uniref:L,D-transpeptidase n=1 Tax=Pseudovibrio sp. Tun.PSC04-5.I4 TaxID=1798213 RepID=UPI00087E76F0|nr:L,D-transpeptidase [Pseudovibrio sp. Tun.PSC04-5.I4]SDQ91829.1 L,D-transpeptidase catalytic domain [Pseudovibrio sp. Tun.PSC04-5.I4]